MVIYQCPKKDHPVVRVPFEGIKHCPVCGRTMHSTPTR